MARPKKIKAIGRPLKLTYEQHKELIRRMRLPKPDAAACASYYGIQLHSVYRYNKLCPEKMLAAGRYPK